MEDSDIGDGLFGRSNTFNLNKDNNNNAPGGTTISKSASSSDISHGSSSANTLSASNSDTGSRKRRGPFNLFRDNPRSDDGTTNSDSNTQLSSYRDLSGFASDYSSAAEDDSINNANANANTFDEPEATADQAKDINTDEINEMLSKELLKMTFYDRTDIQEEIHGVHCLSVEETPQLVKQALHEFRRELEKLSDNKKKTYLEIERATKTRERQLQQQQQQQHQRQYARDPQTSGGGSSSSAASSPQKGTQNTPPPPQQPSTNRLHRHYAVDNDDFHLRFLRAELFDTKRAVLRFVNYFEFVNEFWGFGIASRREVKLSDFSKEELRFFKKGYFQLLPFRDRSGRRVVVILGENKNSNNNNNNNNNGEEQYRGSYDTNPMTKAKCYFYLLDIATRDSAESQKKGFVAVAHPNGICFELQNHELYLVHRLSVSVPARMVASHNFCHDFRGYQLLAKVVMAHVISGAKHKQIIRQKFHLGLNDTEMRYHLQGFGIPIEFFPLTETGTIKHNYFSKWMKTRQYLEAGYYNDGVIDARGGSGSGSSKKKKKDKNHKKLVVVECPLLNDIVFRQGKPYKANPGNDALRDTILEELNRRMIAATTNPEGGEFNNKDTTMKSSGGGDPFDVKSSDAATTTTTNNNNNTTTANNREESAKDSSERFCSWFIDEIEINRKGRFLTWDSTLDSWVQMTDKFKIRRKISVSLYNYEKRHNTVRAKMKRKHSKQQQQQHKSPAVPGTDPVLSNSAIHGDANMDNMDDTDTTRITETTSNTTQNQDQSHWMNWMDALPSFSSSNNAVDELEDMSYRFIEGGRRSQSSFCSWSSMDCSGHNSNSNNDSNSSNNLPNNNLRGGERKRPRDFFFSGL